MTSPTRRHQHLRRPDFVTLTSRRSLDRRMAQSSRPKHDASYKKMRVNETEAVLPASESVLSDHWHNVGKQSRWPAKTDLNDGLYYDARAGDESYLSHCRHCTAKWATSSFEKLVTAFSRGYGQLATALGTRSPQSANQERRHKKTPPPPTSPVW